jgi:hypothetical protein
MQKDLLQIVSFKSVKATKQFMSNDFCYYTKGNTTLIFSLQMQQFILIWLG